MSNIKSQHGHLIYFDLWRGIAILMVVLIHTRVAISSNEVIEIFNLLISFISNSAVPIFLAISGFFLSQKSLATKTELKSFYVRRISKVYYPMIVWSVPLFVLGMARGGDLVTELFKMLTGAYSVYYFIVLIIQCYLILPLIKRYIHLSLILSLLLTMFSWGIVNYILPPLPLIVYAGPVITWSIYFTLGAYLSDKKRNYSIMLPIIMIIVGLLLQYLEASYLYDLKGTGLGQKMSAVVSNIGIVLLMLSTRWQNPYSSRNLICRVLEYLGKSSFGVYLIHVYIIMLMDHFVDIHFWFVKCSLVLVLSLFCIVITKKILPTAYCGKFLGFK